MDAQEPQSIQETLQVATYQSYGNIGLQVRLLSLMCDDINNILNLDAELTARIGSRKKYRIYREYMDKMADILEDLFRAKALLLKAFPAFCNSRLFKVIDIHLNRRQRADKVELGYEDFVIRD